MSLRTTAGAWRHARRLVAPAGFRRLSAWLVALCLGAWGSQAAEAARLPKISVAADGRSLVDAQGRPFHPIGVNYFRPGTGWAPQVWKQFDADATRKDFARLQQMGFNCVRVFLTFGSFFERPDEVSGTGLAKLDEFVSLAEAHGIYVHPTGPDHWEGVADWAKGDRFAEERMLQAQEKFWRVVAARYRGRGAIFAYDLLNEPSIGWNTPVLGKRWNEWLRRRYDSSDGIARAWQTDVATVSLGQVPVPEPKEAPRDRRLLDFQAFREDLADEWTRRQSAAIKSADPEALVTVGLIQWSVPVLLGQPGHYSGFRPARQARWLDFLEVHFYPLEGGFYEYGGALAEARNLAYLEMVVREVAAAGKPVVLAEFGWYGGGKLTIDEGRHAAADEVAQARWGRLAVETTSGLAVGWLNWGFYDHPQARDVTERTGLVRSDGQMKRWGEVFSGLAGEARRRAGSELVALIASDLDWDLLVTAPSAAKRYRDGYFAAVDEKRWPARAQLP